MPDRLYSEAEVQALLKQAAERQQRLGPAGNTHGLTLAEVEAIAAEAGLDPAHVRAAARSGVEEEPRTWLGAPREVRRSRHISGPLTDEAWVALVSDLRRQYDDNGTATQLGPVREWEMGKRENRVHAVAEPDGDGYRITLAQRYEEALKGFMGGSIGMGITPLLILAAMLGTGNWDPWPAVLIFGIAAALFFLIPPIAYRKKAEREAERFEALLDRAEKATLHERLAAPERPAVSEREATPKLSLDLDPEAERPARLRRRTRS